MTRFALCLLLSALRLPLYAGSQVTAAHAAIATSSPLVTQIGVRVMKDGGSAADAAIAPLQGDPRAPAMRHPP